MEKNIKVLMIGSDRKLFEKASSVRVRIAEYGTLAEELHIAVLALASLGLKEEQIAPNVWTYPTNSSSKLSYVRDAARIGKKIVFDRKFVRGKSLITTQDPFECGLAGFRVKKKWRLPLEVQLHTDPFSPYFGGLLNRVRKIISKKVLRHADSVRVVSGDLKEKICKFTSASIDVLPIYIDREKIENAPVAYDLHARFGWHFVLLSVGRLEPEKNLGLALDALALVRQKFPSTGLVIVGSGSEEGRLKAKANKLGLDGNVAFVGWQDNLASFYKTANAYIQTSLFEGYGMSLIEAGLSGLPVLTTPTGFAQELEHGKDAYIYPAGHPELFAEGVIDLMENNHKRENLRINMKRTLESKLLSKEDYLKELQQGWQGVSRMV